MLRIYSNVSSIDEKALFDTTVSSNSVILKYPEYQSKHRQIVFQEVLDTIESSLEEGRKIQLYTNDEIVFNAARIALLKTSGAEAVWICYTASSYVSYKGAGKKIKWNGKEFESWPGNILCVLDDSTATILDYEISIN